MYIEYTTLYTLLTSGHFWQKSNHDNVITLLKSKFDFTTLGHVRC